MSEKKIVELTPAVSHIRVFAEGKCYKNKDTYEGILTVTYLLEDTVYISGAHGYITSTIHKQAIALLKAEGVKVWCYFRDGKLIQEKL